MDERKCEEGDGEDGEALHAHGYAPAPGSFAGDVISINNRNIQMVTAGLNYKFGGWW